MGEKQVRLQYEIALCCSIPQTEKATGGNNSDEHKKVANRCTLYEREEQKLTRVWGQKFYWWKLKYFWLAFCIFSLYLVQHISNPKKAVQYCWVQNGLIMCYMSHFKKGRRAYQRRQLQTIQVFHCWLHNLNKTKLEWAGLIIRMCMFIRNEHVYFFVKVQHLQKNSQSAPLSSLSTLSRHPLLFLSKTPHNHVLWYSLPENGSALYYRNHTISIAVALDLMLQSYLQIHICRKLSHKILHW